MQTHFSKMLKTEAGTFNFYFNFLNGIEGKRFHISTIDNFRKSVMFFMVKHGDRWRLENRNHPTWILNLEEMLENILLEQGT
jgi:hypothetical protein